MSIPSLELKDAYKKYTEDQDKLVPPGETVRWVKERCSRLDLDILADTIRIDNGRLDIPVYLSICGADAERLTGTSRQMGKGAGPAQAEASAVMELVERFSVYSFAGNPENFVSGTYSSLSENAISFDLIAESVNDGEGSQGASREIFSGLQLNWTWAWDLTEGKPVLVPFDWFFAINQFNGTSAGNCQEEAICQGMCEVVERHVSSVIWSEKRPVPAVDPDSSEGEAAAEMIGKFRKNGISLYLSDFSLDTGIPTVGVLAVDPATHPWKSEIVWTAGTATSPEKALCRALSETAQLGGDFNTGSAYEASGLPKLKSTDEAAFVTSPGKNTAISDLPDISDVNIKTEIENCAAALKRKGMHVIALRTTHPGLGIPSFYTIVPGARFRERAAAGSVAMFCGKLISEKYSPEQAAEKLEQIDKKLPGRYYNKFYLGKARLEAGRPESAIEFFNKALDLDPAPQDAASICSYKGICLKELGNYEKAAEALSMGIKQDPERSDLYNLMGFCCFKMHEYKEAIKNFEKALRLNPDSAIDRANIGVNYQRLGEKEKAASYYRAALSMDPGIEFARQGLEELAGGRKD